MTIDIRATVTCSLGTLISASVSDDYVQGSGLIKVKGNAVISGVITPAIGTVVTFAYTKGGVTTTLPRKLRVLSSFADPFRQTTSVELGCKLTYLSDLKDPIKWDPSDDPEYAAFVPPAGYVGTQNFYASSIMAQCLQELGITASSNPLTNTYRRDAWDYGPGYVSVLNDLLVSECYCGYLDLDEVLQVFSLAQDGGTGPVLSSTNLIDIGPINIGQLPGEGVIVRYNAWRFADQQRVIGSQEDVERAAEEDSFTQNSSSSRGSVLITYKNSQGNQISTSYETLSTSEETTTYATFPIMSAQPPEYVVRTGWGYYGEKVRIPLVRRAYETDSSVTHLAQIYQTYYANGATVDLGHYTMEKWTTESFTYDRDYRETVRTLEVYGDSMFLVGGTGLQFYFNKDSYVAFLNIAVQYCLLEKSVIYTYYQNDYRKVVTERYSPWCRTQSGQQAIAEAREFLDNATAVEQYLSAILAKPLVLTDVSVTTEKSNNNRQEVPAESNNAAALQNYSGYLQQISGADRGGLLEQSEEIEFALGSATAQRRVEFQMPLAPDDSVTLTTYNTVSSYVANYQGAKEKARQFGRVQNKLLLGNRNGMNVQTAPESLPSTPFSPVFVSASGYVALYRTNGTSYTMDANGIVASSDLLFMGGVGTV